MQAGEVLVFQLSAARSGSCAPWLCSVVMNEAWYPTAAIVTFSAGCLIAYRQILATGDSIEMWFLKVILLGAPELGKSTVRRRLGGEIADIFSSGETTHPSTGTVESGVVIRNLSSTTALVTSSEWNFTKNLSQEANVFLQYFFSHYLNTQVTIERSPEVNTAPETIAEGVKEDVPIRPQPEESAVSHTETPHGDSHEVTSKPSAGPKASNSSRSSITLSEVAELFRKAVHSEHWKDIKHLLKDTAYIKMEDTGGQPEFMDMLAALTIGPALYLLFCKLIDDLHSHYTVSYRSPSGESSTPVQSTYTVEEVLLSALASVQVTVPTLKLRRFHSATSFYLCLGLTEVIIFGGFDEDDTDLANTTVLRFGEFTSCVSHMRPVSCDDAL